MKHSVFDRMFMLPVAAVGVLSAAAMGDAQSWSFDVTTQGQDVFWTSPTAVDPDASAYHGAYQLTLIEVGISWNGIPFGTIDVTDEVPEEDRQGEQTVDGPAPILLLDNQIVAPEPPEPPEPPAIIATVRVELDGDGFGKVSITDVTLGTVTVDLGFPIGVQTVQITSVRVAGAMDIEPKSPNVVGDLNGDGVVDVSDLLLLFGAWGACPAGGSCPADFNGDGSVDVSDLLILFSNWG